MTTISYTFISILLVSLVSLIGIFTLALKADFIKKILLFMVAFSAGGLLGDSFIHLLPESVNESGFNLTTSFSIFAGIIVFFVLEKLLRWHHCHDASCVSRNKHLGSLSLLSDSIHNLIDGILIGASFLISIPLGIATTLAVVLHEIPQELGNFSILLHSGYTVRKALLYNFFSALSAFFGGALALFVGDRAESFQTVMIPFTVGTFIYIALSDLVPELHKENGFKKSIIQLLSFIMGIGFMLILLVLD